MLAFLSDIFVVGLLGPFMLGLKTEQDTVHPVHPEQPRGDSLPQSDQAGGLGVHSRASRSQLSLGCGPPCSDPGGAEESSLWSLNAHGFASHL